MENINYNWFDFFDRYTEPEKAQDLRTLIKKAIIKTVNTYEFTGESGNELDFYTELVMKWMKDKIKGKPWEEDFKPHVQRYLQDFAIKNAGSVNEIKTERTEFNRMLLESKRGENIVADYFRSKGYEVKDISKDISKGADLEITTENRKLKIEVKYDSLIHKTGNIVAECVRLNDGWNGWTLTTHADYIVWISQETGQFYVLDRETLQKATYTLYKPNLYHKYKSLLTGKQHIESNHAAVRSIIKERKKLKTDNTELGFLTMKKDPINSSDLGHIYIIAVMNFNEILRKYKGGQPIEL